MSTYDDYQAAKAAYDAAESALAVARANLTRAERARSAEWDRLVNAAATLPEDAIKRVVKEQFGHS